MDTMIVHYLEQINIKLGKIVSVLERQESIERRKTHKEDTRTYKKSGRINKD